MTKKNAKPKKPTKDLLIAKQIIKNQQESIKLLSADRVALEDSIKKQTAQLYKIGGELQDAKEDLTVLHQTNEDLIVRLRATARRSSNRGNALRSLEKSYNCQKLMADEYRHRCEQFQNTHKILSNALNEALAKIPFWRK